MSTDLEPTARRTQFKIIHIMIAAVVFALIFAILRSERQEWATSGLAMLFIYFLVIVCWVVWVATNQQTLQALLDHPPDERDELIERLEASLKRRDSEGLETTTRARFRLMQLYQQRTEYEKAIEQGRMIITFSRITYAFESKVHLDIADCFDYLGQSDEAESHRQAADDCLDSRPENLLGWTVQAELHEKQSRFVEAADAFERALELCPSDNQATRSQLLLQLILSTYQAGRPDETIMWAERAIDAPVRPPLLYLAHRIAGIAASSLALFDESRRHRMKSLELANEEGDSKKVAECIASLADLRLQLGDLDKAESLCDEAAKLSSESNQDVLVIQAAIFHARGRADLAAMNLDRAISMSAFAKARHERRTQALRRIWLALYQADADQIDEAWRNLRAAVAQVGDEPRTGLLCEAASVWLLANQGKKQEVQLRADAILPRLDANRRDCSNRWNGLEMLGRAFYEIGDHERSQECWDRYLQGPTQPIGLPVAHYFIGECQWHRGDAVAALEAFQKATDLGIDSHFARLARRRGRELFGEKLESAFPIRNNAPTDAHPGFDG